MIRQYSTCLSKTSFKHWLSCCRHLLLIQIIAFSHYALAEDELDTPLGKIKSKFTLIDSKSKHTEVNLHTSSENDSEQINWTLSPQDGAGSLTSGVISVALLQTIANAWQAQQSVHNDPPEGHQPQNALPGIIALALTENSDAPVADTNLQLSDFSNPLSMDLQGNASNGNSAQANLSFVQADGEGNAGLQVSVGLTTETFHVNFDEEDQRTPSVIPLASFDDDEDNAGGGTGTGPGRQKTGGKGCWGFCCLSSSTDSGDEGQGSTSYEGKQQASTFRALGAFIPAASYLFKGSHNQ